MTKDEAINALRECIEQLDGVTGASDRPGSDSAVIVADARRALEVVSGHLAASADIDAALKPRE